MPVPTYDQFIEPILRFLAGQPQGATAAEAYEASAVALGLGEEDKQELPAHKIERLWKFQLSEVDKCVRAGGAIEERTKDLTGNQP